MKSIKKVCTLIGAVATGIMLTSAITASAAPTMYLDYEQNDSTLTVKLMAKDLETTYEADGSVAPIRVISGSALVEVETGANDGAYTLPTAPNANAAKNKNWLTTNFKMNGYFPIVNYATGNTFELADSTNRYLKFQQGGNASDETTWLEIDENGVAELGSFQLTLVDPESADTTITLVQGNINLFNATSEDWMIEAGRFQAAYTSVTTPASLNLESLALKIGKTAVPTAATPVATYTEGEDYDVQTFRATIAAADVAKTLTWTVTANGQSKSDTANIDTNIGGDIEEVIIGLIVQGPSAASATATITVE